MKFYDLEWLAKKCGTDNKYEITTKVSAEARRESEEFTFDKNNPDANERFISNVLSEIENDTSPISVNYESGKAKIAERAAPEPRKKINPKPEFLPEIEQTESEGKADVQEDKEEEKVEKAELEETTDEETTDEEATEKKPERKREKKENTEKTKTRAKKSSERTSKPAARTKRTTKEEAKDDIKTESEPAEAEAVEAETKSDE
ncbi:MAG: hypothetical protein SPL10_02295 [Synergistales bacterium]|nr:hypothetical protein [Synergistales bacterium]MDY6402041.1 hypothetical protein [Synergistales bacterium]MDY6404184.1 hypothetical protein [Synergistales bacterium]MDY6410832.1 hypothetical protein [Synergistales bacterium]MDY6413973.1 hypothetical protein [Synergistales bacterium]